MGERLFFVWLMLCLFLTGCQVSATPASENDLTPELAAFAEELEELRVVLKIPGLAAAVVKDGQVIWARGLGYADLDKQVPVTPDTPFHLASVTKTSAAVVVMRLVQDGKLSLDDPVSHYGVQLPEGDLVLVRHLLSHTSEGTPGQRFQYNGMRYGMLSQVVLDATGRSLQDWLYELILSPLQMKDTAPGPAAACAGLSFSPQCEKVQAALAAPYMLDADLNLVSGYHGDSYNAGAGLISTVMDLARFDVAMDDNRLVTAETKEMMWTPTRSTSGQRLPYGLGWFTQDYRGTRMIWHSGFSPPSTSALYLKLPEDKLTLIVLANTDLLSRSWDSTGGDVLGSPVAVAFMKCLVVEPARGGALPRIDYSQSSTAVLGEIRQVKDEEGRTILVKEYEARKAIGLTLDDLVAQQQALQAKRARAGEIYLTLDQAVLVGYAGDYALVDAGGVVITVSHEQGELLLSQAGGPPQTLLPESESAFLLVNGYDTIELEFGQDPADGTGRVYVSLYGLHLTGRRK